MNLNSYGIRKFKNHFFFVVCAICVVLAVAPLISILWEVIARGAPQLSLNFLTATNAKDGIGPAIQGTLILIGLTSLIGVPIGILSGVYLSEYGNNHFGSGMRIINDALTGVPSIVIGITAYGVIVIGLIGSYSAIAGAIALSFMIIPIIARTTEESLKLVPNNIREASLALGAHKWKTTLRVVLPSAKSAVVTGVLLGVARVAGETAPLIMTILGNRYFFQGLNEPMAALPLEIWRDSLQAQQSIIAQGWGAALVLILMVLSINILVRVASRGRLRK
jgi:phosphate transport system permease protein